MYSAPQTSENSSEEIDVDEQEPEPLIDEVRWALKEISDGKSPGCDDVPIELIKEGKEKSITLYHTIVLKIWRTYSWPIAWKRSVYIPLPIKEILRYVVIRTIALIRHTSKTILKIIQNVSKIN